MEAGSAEPSSGKRIIAFGAPAVELVCALGLEGSLVARSTWDSFPPSVQKLPPVGDPFQPDMERILSLAPDLMLTDGRFGRLEARMKPLGIEVFPVEAYHPAEVIPAARRLAEKLGLDGRGGELVAELEALGEFVDARLAGLPDEERLAGIQLTDANELFCIAMESGNTFLESAGAKNLASGLGHPFPLLSREWLVGQKPDFILIPLKEGRDAESLKESVQMRLREYLPAHCRVIVMEEGLTYGLRSFLGILRLAAELYPGRFGHQERVDREAAFLGRIFGYKPQGGTPCK